jgi:hypothetical protein
MELKGLIFWGILLIFGAAVTIISGRIKKGIEERGIQVPGTVSRIEDDGDTDFNYYVRYMTREGEEIEGLLSNPRGDLEVGQKVLVKYHPELKHNCRLVL